MEFLPTKGLEYLLAIGYLLLLVPFAFTLRSRWTQAPVLRSGRRLLDAGAWFPLPQGLGFHRGHTWARPEADGVFRVGMDGFAWRMLGSPDALHLPPPGTELEAGDTGWRVTVDGQDLSLLSPIHGEVVEVNTEALRAPDGARDDPYRAGWLLAVRPSRPANPMKNLLSGKLARAWMDESFGEVSHRLLPQLGAVLQDGGEPVEGFVRVLEPERWPALAAEALLTAEPGGAGSRSSFP